MISKTKILMKMKCLVFWEPTIEVWLLQGSLTVSYIYHCKKVCDQKPFLKALQ